MTNLAAVGGGSLLLGTDRLTWGYSSVNNTAKFCLQMAQMSGKAVSRHLIGRAVELVFHSTEIPVSLGCTGLARQLFGQQSGSTKKTACSG